MKNVSQYFNKLFYNFGFFHHYLGPKIFFALILSFFVGILDGLGLSMFLPLLQMMDGSNQIQTPGSSNGNFDYLMNGITAIGLPMTLASILMLILFFFTLKGIFKFLESYYTVVLMASFIKKVRLDSILSISNINYKYFVQVDSGKIQNTLSGEMERLYIAYKSYMATIQSSMMIMVYIGLAFLSNPQFTLFLFIGGFLSNLVYNRLYKKTKANSFKITADNHVFHGLVLQEITFFKYLRATGQVTRYSEKLKRSIFALAKGYKKQGFYNSILLATREPLVIFVVVLIILIQVSYLNQDMGPIVLSLLFFYRSLTLIINLQTNWNNFLNVSGSLANFREFLADLKNNQMQYHRGKAIGQIDKIELSGVNFSYNEGVFLKDIHLQIPKNKTIALVGPSGSGKTTLINILTGLLPIDQGDFRINGELIEKTNLQEYQSKIGYITQEAVIFNDSIFNNVTFWDEKNEANLEKFSHAIHKASLSGFLDGLEKGGDTILGNNGILISGGQRQRMAIARELYKEVDLLVLDEATSALDSATEKEIQDYFETLQGSYTIVLIAHRLSTIKNADLIYLLKDGKIVDQGNFESLVKRSVDFKLMVGLQNFN